jgi:hypothetical protein
MDVAYTIISVAMVGLSAAAVFYGAWLCVMFGDSDPTTGRRA